MRQTGIVIVDNSENNSAETIEKFILEEHLSENLGYMSRRVSESATSQCSQYECIMAVKEGYSENSAYLILQSFGLMGHNTHIGSQVGTVQTGNRNDSRSKRSMHKGIPGFLSMAENSDGGGIDTSEIAM